MVCGTSLQGKPSRFKLRVARSAGLRQLSGLPFDSASDAMRIASFLALLGFFVTLAACDLNNPNTLLTTRLVPDSTVFIVSTLEASPDTSFHHTQVYVGRLSDPLIPYYDLFTDFAHKPNEELWMPIQWAQVGMKLRNLRLRPHPDNTAEVSITGPLGQAGERTIRFQHERRGVYGDLDQELVRVPRGTYRLDVRLADGRSYTAETTTPGLAEWVVPDTFRVSTELQPDDGSGYHYEAGRLPLEWGAAEDAAVAIFGFNRSLAADRATFGLEADENFPHEDRGDYIRMGAFYFVFTTSFSDAGPAITWAESSVDPLVSYHDLYLRLYQLSPALSRYYAPEDYEYSHVDGDPWAEAQWNTGAVVGDRDTTYFHSVSNILRIGPDGQALPHAESDAVGIFGGYTARYARSAMTPVRSFDPDTLGWYP